jgi:uncharacterized membrane protein
MSTSPKPTQPPTPGNAEAAINRFANRLVLGIAHHWLAIFNLAWGLYIGLPWLAPILLHLGYATPARLIYAFYSFMCHQLPDHSYFLFGPYLTPDLATLEQNGMGVGLNLFEQREFIGNLALGYKVAICQRDVAIYGAVLLAGLAFALLRRRLGALHWRWYLVLLVPIALDGGLQMIGLHESNWFLRSLTGALFGIASVWLAYPYIEDAMQDVIDTEQQRTQSI